MCVLGCVSFRRGCGSLGIHHGRLSSRADADQRSVDLIRRGHEVLPGGINKLAESSKSDESLDPDAPNKPDDEMKDQQ